MPGNEERHGERPAYGLWVWRTAHVGMPTECDECHYQFVRQDYAIQCDQGTHKLAVLCYGEDDTRRPTYLSRIEAGTVRALAPDYQGFIVECAHETRGGTVICAGRELREPEPKRAPAAAR